jgi:CRP/FNR family transcriptional regulator
MLTLARTEIASRPSAASRKSEDPLGQCLQRAATRVTAHRDEAIFWEGDAADHCYRIVTGAVRISKVLPDGRRQIADFFAAGDLIGFEPGASYDFTAEAVVDSVLLKCPRRQLEAFLAEDAAAQRTLLSVALERLSAAQRQMVLLGRKSASEKVASFLSVLSARSRTVTEVYIPMSRTDIADHLGLTIETVSRAFTKLRRQGIIALPRPQHIEILDADALHDLADGACS